ncbi:MAG: TIGR03936 family radical SAM-associated protein [Chloroflexota bacterium]
MRVRVTFAKTGSLRYIGHLDLQQVWERTVRRANLPLAYTQGFHPGPKIQIAAALPLGFSGRAEVVDLWMKDDVGAAHVVAQSLQSAAPPGLTIISVEAVDEHAPALQTQVAAAEYDVTLLEAGPRRCPEPVEGSGLERGVKKVLRARSLPRERRGKAYDLRPLILSLECRDLSLRMTLSAREGATGRPEEVLAEMGIPVEGTRIERTRLIFKNEIE